MNKKFNKNKKILCALSLSIPSIIIPTTIGLTSCTSEEETIEKNLTKEKVNKNFAENGIWYNKKVITFNDWENISLIEPDAFDGLAFQIDELQIPQHIMVKNPEKGLIWKNVSKITWAQKTSGTNITFTKNNIIYILGNNADYIALTIADRTLKMPELLMPQKSDFKLNYMISSNFYNESVFKNIDHIKFPQNTPLYSIAKGAFNNCQKLDSVLNLSIDLKIVGSHVKSLFFISENTFNNSNITELTINAQNTDYGIITLSQFGKLETFKKMTIKNISNLFMMQSQYEQNKITDLVVLNSNAVFLSDKLFARSFGLNNVQIEANEWIICENELYWRPDLNLNIKLRSKNIVLQKAFTLGTFNSFHLTFDTMGNFNNPIYLTNETFDHIWTPDINEFSISYPSRIIFDSDKIDFENSGLPEPLWERLMPLN